MQPQVSRDPRLRTVVWRDLTRLTTAEVASELLLPLPWLAASLAMAHKGLFLLALPASFMLFLVGLRQVHNAFHCALGLPRRGCDWIMFVLSGVMLGSMHAVRLNHLEHHRHCLSEGDVEGASARMSGWQAILTGPMFPVRLHVNAWKMARGIQKLWIAAELALTVAIVASACVSAAGWLLYHVIAMAIGQCLTAFFAVWTVHHDCETKGLLARTLRGVLRNFSTYNMFFHVEHHLFPAVPTRHLPQLAARVDKAAPELTRLRVF